MRLRRIALNLRLAVRQLAAEPGYVALIVLGLALAVAACLLVAQLVVNQVLPDPRVPDPARVLSLEFHGNIPGHPDDWFDGAPMPFGPALVAAHAPVVAMARTREDAQPLRAGERLAMTALLRADPDLIALFGLRALRGDLRAALGRPHSLALTPEAVRRLFGDVDPIGRMVSEHGTALTVVALVEAPATASPLRFEGLRAIDLPGEPLRKDLAEGWYAIPGQVWLRLAPGHTAAEVAAAAQAIFDHGPGAATLPPEWTANGRKGAFLRAIPLTERALTGAGSAARARMLLGLALGAVLVLLLAIVNEVNLTLTRTLRRAREIAVRKSLGASPAALAGQFVLEATLVALVAAALGLLLAWLSAPLLGDVLGLRLEDRLFTPGRLLGLAVGALQLGLAGGLYPARVALGVRCAETLAGRTHGEPAGGRRLRRVATMLQFTVALVLTGGALAVWSQNRFVATLERGFRTEGLLWLDVNAEPDKARGFRDALLREPGVRAAAWSLDIPGHARYSEMTGYETREPGRPPRHVDLRTTWVDPAFFGVYGIRPLAGEVRLLRRHQAAPSAPSPAAASEFGLVIDETAARALGYATPQAAVGQVLGGGGNFGFMQAGSDRSRIVAVVPRVRQETARDALEPQTFPLTEDPQSVLTLAGPDMATLRHAVETVWPRWFPDDVLTMSAVDAELDRVYGLDHHIAGLGALAGLLALLLAAAGVYALAAWMVRRSAREIVVRKLHGAGRARIAAFVAREFMPLLALSALVGLPLAGWLTQAWLSHYVERSPAAWLALPGALVLVLAMTALAALRHALAAMAMRPVAALRD